LRQSKTLQKLRDGKAVRMCAMGHMLPFFVRQAADNGFDCIWLDAEHRAFTDRELQTLLAFFHLFDVDCMLRPATVGKTRLYRYLEDGATGLMIPHVSTEEQAKDLVQSVKFPPIGNRGIDGVGLDSGFSFEGVEDYPERANKETFLVVQIETPEAVENADAIAAIEGIDGLFVGPGDLGIRLKRQPEISMTLDEAMDTVAQATSRHGKAWGRPAATLDDMKKFHDQGAQLIAHGGDFVAIMKMLQESAADFDQLLAGE